MTALRARRTFSDPDADTITSIYEAATPAGTFTITRQFYAQGASLFEWELAGPGTLRSFPTKRAALRYLETLSPTS